MVASEYLTANGMEILQKNFRGRQGEIDIIGYHQGYLVFVEVKFRSTKRLGNAAEAVDIRKQRRICKVADYYRYIHRLPWNQPVRYDVVTIQEDLIEWIPNAFFHRTWDGLRKV